MIFVNSIHRKTMENPRLWRNFKYTTWQMAIRGTPDNGIGVCEVGTEGSNLGEGIARTAYTVLYDV